MMYRGAKRGGKEIYFSASFGTGLDFGDKLEFGRGGVTNVPYFILIQNNVMNFRMK